MRGKTLQGRKNGKKEGFGLFQDSRSFSVSRYLEIDFLPILYKHNFTVFLEKESLRNNED